MAIDWVEPIRAYCERGDGGFWAEPFGAVSNAAFLVAAAAAALRARAARDPAALALAGLVAVVGFGSFLFHTLAVFWAMLADVVPIAAFVVAYVLLALRRFLDLSWLAATPLTVAFAAIDLGLTPVLEAATGLPLARLTNGSLDYLPAALALAGVTAALLVRPDPAGLRRTTALRLAGIAALFLVSLALRTVDRAACAAIPFGTHGFWHVLNAAVLYALVATAVRHRTGATADSCGRT
ncbi:ceramidase domain-containing protein [Methylobacterium sp. NEAU 140]|uniref:ceramidase domain-containing protein n=1 Tax=Methylobacterium sp. NEAU 140 TaxID=3064945 RepID=UPI0027361ABF|nr:ceramidase domain-containing protein [Methylobacterium sp. NEAU 140]MDP4023190.1 ceramidase domain-containing protein [Methylobacterium sp. NEAU 140]